MGQILSVPMLVAGFYLIWRARPQADPVGEVSDAAAG